MKMRTGNLPVAEIPVAEIPVAEIAVANGAPSWSYDAMRKEVDELHVEMGGKMKLLPSTFTGAAVCEEAFALLNDTIFGRQLDEEATTSAFITALMGATRYWAPWAPGGETAIAWVQHFGKDDESRIGADFALVLCRDTDYFIAVLQAKRVDNDRVKTATVKRRPSSKELDKDANGKLLAMLNGVDKTGELTGVHWQLTKLLALRNRIGKNTAEIGYVFWPDDGGLPLYRSLDGAERELAKPGSKGVVPGQQFVLQGAADFKAWLIRRCDASTGGGLSVEQAEMVLQEIDASCSTAVILDVGANKLGLALKKKLGWQDKPPLAPTQVAAQQNVPKN